MKKKVMSVFLAFALTFSMLPSVAFAEELPEAEIEEVLQETEADLQVETEEILPEEAVIETEEPVIETETEAAIETETETVIEPEESLETSEEDELESEIISEETEDSKDQILTSGKVGENVTFTFDKSTGELVLSGSGATYEYSMGKSPFSSSDFAQAIKTVKVGNDITRLGSSLFLGTYFSSISLSSSLREIGEYCFQDSCITSISLPSSLVKIEKFALTGKKLTSLTIPASVSSIGAAIVSPEYTSTITVSSGNIYYYAENGVLIDNYSKTIIASTSSVPIVYKMPNDIEGIGTAAFADNKTLDTVEFSSNLKKIGLSAFRSCSNLRDVDLQLNYALTEIAAQAFMDCKNVDYIGLPYSVKTIGPHAFKNTAINHINLTDGVTYYQNWFDGCSDLEDIHFPRSITKLYVEDVPFDEIHYGGTKAEWDAMVAGISIASAKTKVASIPTSFGYDLEFTAGSKEHGRVSTTKSKMYDNETVTLTVFPDSGYKIAKVSEYNDNYACEIKDNGDGTYEISDPIYANLDYDYILLDVSYEKSPELTGNVFYTSGIAYNTTISLAFSSELNELNSAGKLKREWQVLSNGTWVNVTSISNYGSITNNLLKPGTGLIGKTIRLKVTADGYYGFVVGKTATVSKASNRSAVTLPNTSYNTSTKKIQIYLSSVSTAKQLEYVALPQGTALTASAWNNAVKGSSTTSSYLYLSQDANGNSLVTNSYYVVYARYAETTTTSAGINTAQTIIYTGTEVSIPAGGLSLNGYPSGSTFYVDISKLASTTISWNITVAPSNATSWRQISWGSSSSTTVASIDSVGSYTVSASSGYVVTPASSTNSTFPSKMTLSYKGTGTTTIGAYNWSNGELVYGKWTVKFYDSSNLTVSDITLNPSSIADQTINLGETKIFDEISSLTMTPANSKYTYYWREGYITQSNAGSPIFTAADNEYIDVNSDTGAVTGLKVTDSTTVSKSAVRLYLYDKNRNTRTATSIFFKVNVEDARIPAEGMGGLPSERKLNPKEKIRLSAKVYPIDSTDTIRWASNDNSVATVDADGIVTAVGAGDCVITAKAGTIRISCKLHVNSEVVVCAYNAKVNGEEEVNNFYEGQTVTIEANDKTTFCKWDEIQGTLGTVYGSTFQYVVGTEDLVIEAVSHKEALKRNIAATCTEDGSTGGSICLTCKKVLTKSTVIPATGHIEGEPVEEVKKAPTYTEAGITDTVCYCTKCKEEVFRCSEDTPKLVLQEPVLRSISNAYNGPKITWSEVEGAGKYRVYRKAEGGSYTKLIDVTGTSYTDTSAESGTTYYYSVRAYDASGKAYSTLDKTGLKIKYLRGMLTSEYTINNGSTYISLKWAKITGATGYLIYRKAGSGSYAKIKTITSGTTVTYADKDTSIKNGVLYTYMVRPTGGTATVSSQSAKIFRLTAPTIKSLANSSAGALKVTLTAANTKATGYQIEYAASSTFSSSKKVNITSNATLAKTLTSLTKGKTYYVRVRAYKKYDGVTYYSAFSAAKYLKITK